MQTVLENTAERTAGYLCRSVVGWSRIDNRFFFCRPTLFSDIFILNLFRKRLSRSVLSVSGFWLEVWKPVLGFFGFLVFYFYFLKSLYTDWSVGDVVLKLVSIYLS